MTGEGEMTARQEWRESWPLAVACPFGFVTAAIFLYTFGSFIEPIQQEFGWSRATITSGLSVLTLVSGLSSPFIGILVDKWGPRRIALPGAVAVLASYCLISLATTSVATWWAIWIVMSLAGMTVQTTVWTAAIAANFDKGRGLALAVALCGSGLTSATLPLLATYLIDNYGWRSAPPLIALSVAVIVLPILYFGLHSNADTPRRGGPERKAAMPVRIGTSAREALRTVPFFKLAFAAFVFSVCALGIVPNIIPILTSFHIGRTEAAAIAGIVGLTSITGRLVTGYLMDNFNASFVAGSCVLFPIVTCLLLLAAPGNDTVAMIAIAVLGLSLGAEVDVIAYLTAQQFGTASYGTIFGVIAGLYSLAVATGPFLVNLIYDVTGGYELALKLAIPFFVLTSLSLATLGPPRREALKHCA